MYAYNITYFYALHIVCRIQVKYSTVVYEYVDGSSTLTKYFSCFIFLPLALWLDFPILMKYCNTDFHFNVIAELTKVQRNTASVTRYWLLNVCQVVQVLDRCCLCREISGEWERPSPSSIGLAVHGREWTS